MIFFKNLSSEGVKGWILDFTFGLVYEAMM